VIGSLMALIGHNIQRQRKFADVEMAQSKADDKKASDTAEEGSVKHMLRTSEIELVLGKQLASKLVSDHQELAFRMGKTRKKFAVEYGYVIPEVKLSEDFQIAPKSYQIKIHGTAIASYELRLDEVLALIGNGPVPDIPGELVREPAFGMQALSVSNAFVEDLKRMNLQAVDTISVILTHLSEVIRTNLSQLLSYRDMRTLIDRLEPEYRKLADDICTSHLTYPGLQAILKMLLAERVSIRNLHLIIEAVAEVAAHLRRTEKIVEHVRMRIAQQICGDIAAAGVLNIVRLGSRWDLAFHESLKKNAKGEIIEFEMDPRMLEKFASEAQTLIARHSEGGTVFALITNQDARPYVRMIIERFAPGQPVLSHAEIARGIQLQILGSVS
jgi:flagellar biosynthesis protein FlhA